jgi:nucleotide-binding universal stress UspA family protein
MIGSVTATTGINEHPGGRIVVGVDGSPASLRALAWAARQASLTSARLDAVIAWRIPTAAYEGFAPAFDFGVDLAKGAKETLDRALAQVLGQHAGVEVTPAVVEGAPAVELLRWAQGADLLAVGSRGHGEFTGMLLGSVSEHCVAHAPCPVVVIPPEN